MYSICKKIYPQSFDISEHFIDVKFKYDDAAMSILQTENASVNVGVKLSKTAQKVLDCIRENGAINAEKIAENVGKDKRTVERAIKSLREQGIIERNGSDKAGSWKVIE